MRFVILILILIHLTSYAEQPAEQLDPSSQQALEETKELMRNSRARNEFLSRDPMAKEVDFKAGQVVGTAKNKEELYDMASQITDKVAKEANGDPQKMKELLEEAQKNPQAFYDKYFDDQQKARVKKISNDVEQNRKPSTSTGK